MSFPPRDSIALSTLHDYLTFAWLLLVGYNFRAIGERFFLVHTTSVDMVITLKGH